MSFKNHLYAQETHTGNDFDNSNLSGSTFNELKISKLQKLTDKTLTKTSMNYKPPGIYDAGGNIQKQWFVYYSFKDQETGKFKRFKVFEDINTFKTIEQRRTRAVDWKNVYAELLSEGYNPFDKKPEHPLLYGKDKQVGSCIDRYMSTIESSSLSRHTKRKYKYEMDVFKKWLNEAGLIKKHIREIKKQNIRDYIDYLKRERTLTGKTVNAYLNDTRTFFNYFIDNFDDYLDKNPASKISIEKVITKGNVAYTDKEFASVKKEILKSDPYLWLICQVVYYSALRNEAEAINIKIGDFDLQRNRIDVPAEISKARKTQSIPIYPEFKMVLETLKLDQYPEDWFLFGRNDQPGPVRVGEDRFARRFRAIKKALGMGAEYGIYSFKHTRACHLFDDGADLREIQILFRHEDLHVTMNYLRTLNRVERARTFEKGRMI